MTKDRTKFISEIDTGRIDIRANAPFKVQKEKGRRYIRLEISETMSFAILKDAQGGFYPDGDGPAPAVEAVVEVPVNRDVDGDTLDNIDEDIDGDGIPDELDACPNEAEDRDGYWDHDGCPDAAVCVIPAETLELETAYWITLTVTNEDLPADPPSTARQIAVTGPDGRAQIVGLGHFGGRLRRRAPPGSGMFKNQHKTYTPLFEPQRTRRTRKFHKKL